MIRTLLRTRRCVAALEFALIAPTLIAAFAGICDIGTALYTWSKLEQALSLGSNYVIVNKAQANSTNGQTLAENVARIVATSNTGPAANSAVVVNNGPSATYSSPGPAQDGTGTTLLNADKYYCMTGSPTSWAWGSMYANNSTACTDGSQPGQFVTITVSFSFTPFFPGYVFTGGSHTMTAGAAVQVN